MGEWSEQAFVEAWNDPGKAFRSTQQSSQHDHLYIASSTQTHHADEERDAKRRNLECILLCLHNTRSPSRLRSTPGALPPGT